MQATTYINNLLVGKRNLDHRGNFEVVNMATNDAFQCSIKEPFFARSRHEVCSMHGFSIRYGAQCASASWSLDAHYALTHVLTLYCQACAVPSATLVFLASSQ